MKRLLLISFIATFQLSSVAQRSLSLKEAHVVNRLNEKLSKFFGANNFKSYIKLDTSAIHTSEYGHPRFEQLDYSLRYYVILNSDTVGFMFLRVDSNANEIPGAPRYGLGSSPQELIAIKKLLDNKLLISYSEALEFGKKHGIELKPYLTGTTSWDFKLDKNEYFVKVNTYWNFYQERGDNTWHEIKLDAETGKVIIDISNSGRY